MIDKNLYDFSGWATKVDIECSDGRTIRSGAFKKNHMKIVPLVWQHMHFTPDNILGHALLEDREQGTYAYCNFNDTEAGQNGRKLVQHGDITYMSIFANELVQKGKDVMHGAIREVSLVLTGANPGARIENLTFSHSDGTSMESDDEAIIHTEEPIELIHADTPVAPVAPVAVAPDTTSDETVEDVFNTLDEDQKTVVYALISTILEGGDSAADSVAQADSTGSEVGSSSMTVQEVFDTLSEKQKTVVYALIASVTDELAAQGSEAAHSDIDEGDNLVKTNVFDKEDETNEGLTLTHAQFGEIVRDAQLNGGSLKQSVMVHTASLGYGIDDIDLMFPEAKTDSAAPFMVSRNMEWVNVVLNGTRKSPFTRIKSMFVDLTEDAARAKGYIKGALKANEVIKLLTPRVTVPTTIYKKQKLDRDDILDITDFDVVAWLKAEMRVMLDEEVARAILLGDGRQANHADKINEEHIRPIYSDVDFFAHHVSIPAEAEYEDIVDIMIAARKDYKGSGNPTLFTSADVLAGMLSTKDNNGRRLYNTQTELETVLRVAKIVEVGLTDDLHRDTDATPAVQMNFIGIIVNLRDYTVGSDKGGQVSMFDDFDIDYNQQKYLIETRLSGSLNIPKSALVFEQVNA